jgi:hypothetical protein
MASKWSPPDERKNNLFQIFQIFLYVSRGYQWRDVLGRVIFVFVVLFYFILKAIKLKM